MTTCSLDYYQHQAMYYAKPECRLLANAALGLTGESGEFAEHVKKTLFHGKELDNAAVTKELGDVLWYVALACEVLGVRMSDVAAQNLDKLAARYPNGFVPGGGVR